MSSDLEDSGARFRFAEPGAKGAVQPSASIILPEFRSNGQNAAATTNSHNAVFVTCNNVDTGKFNTANAYVDARAVLVHYPLSDVLQQAHSGLHCHQADRTQSMQEEADDASASRTLWLGTSREPRPAPGPAAPFSMVRGASMSSQGVNALSVPTPSVASLSTISGGANDVGSIDDIERSLARRVKARDCKTLVDELKLKSLLGVGSMGTVYNAELLGQRFVVKVVEHGSGLLKRDQARGWLARMEAAVSSHMVHPNIVATYIVHTGEVSTAALAVTGRHGRQQDRMKLVTLLVQEFCSRGTLRDAMTGREFGSRADGLSYCKVCAQLLSQVAFGLMHLHSCSVVHCDLTAGNIMLQSVPEDQRFAGDVPVRAKIGDLGIAYVMPHGGTASAQPPTHGTVTHMPPEALEDATMIRTATDIWSFGMLMWEVWTGECPFKGLPAQGVIQAVKEGRLPVWPDNTPPVWRSLATKCWDLDPAERPAAAQLVRTLEKISGILNKVDTVTRAADAAQSPVEAGAEGSREFPVKAAQPPPQEWEDELDELEALICAPPSGELVHGAPGSAEDDSKAKPEGESSIADLPKFPVTAPEGDASAALLWHLLHMPEPSDCVTVELPLGRTMVVSKVPYMNASHLLGRG